MPRFLNEKSSPPFLLRVFLLLLCHVCASNMYNNSTLRTSKAVKLQFYEFWSTFCERNFAPFLWHIPNEKILICPRCLPPHACHAPLSTTPRPVVYQRRPVPALAVPDLSSRISPSPAPASGRASCTCVPALRCRAAGCPHWSAGAAAFAADKHLCRVCSASRKPERQRVRFYRCCL